jgi:hypothetical protein
MKLAIDTLLSILIALVYFTVGYSTHKLITVKRKRAMRAHPSWGSSK